MSRRGFVLVAMLWVIALLGTIVAGAMVWANEGAGTTRNRMALIRAGWAREACLEILHARFAETGRVLAVDTVDLGRNTWCTARLEDPQARLSLNSAPAYLLRAALGSDSLVDALLDWIDADSLPRPAGAEAAWYRKERRALPRNGPIADLLELQLVKGFEAFPIESLQTLFTAQRTGRLNLNSASTGLLGSLGLLSPEAVGVLATRRRFGRVSESLEDLASEMSPAGRLELLGRLTNIGPLVTFGSDRLVAQAQGGVRGERPVPRAVLDVVASGRRLAVLTKAVR